MRKKGLKEEILFGQGFKGEIRFNEPMSAHTSLRIGGLSDMFCVPSDVNSIVMVRNFIREKNYKFLTIGGGTNILIRDGGIRGVVLSVSSLRRVETLKVEADNVHLLSEAGAPLQRLVTISKEMGLSGIEGLVGIPGTIAGAICGNSGAFGYEMKDVIESIEIIDSKGKRKLLRKDEIVFGYRYSSISHEDIILSAEIRLKKESKDVVCKKIDEFLKIKKERQPLWEHSAGCVFKNPPEMPAGKLIEEAGCKGLRIGDVEVSKIHANFFVNRGNALARDFISLIEEVKNRVYKRFKITLETEIRIFGEDAINN